MVLTLLRTDTQTLLVNRGFVSSERRSPSTRRGQPAGQVATTRLLRTSQPGAGFLRSNHPAVDCWYSRDIAAIARARQLGKVAPMVLDADVPPDSGAYPVGEPTVVAFPNNHLVYALTWFALAAMSLSGAILLLRRREAR